jgi:hypothetical protein
MIPRGVYGMLTNGTPFSDLLGHVISDTIEMDNVHSLLPSQHAGYLSNQYTPGDRL